MDGVEKRGTSSSFVKKGSRAYHDANFKLIVVRYAEENNNSAASRHFGISEANVRRWRSSKERLRNANSTRKAFSGPKKGRFGDIDKIVVEFVREKRNEGVAITTEIIKMKAREVASSLNIPRTLFKASTGWCVRMMRRSGLALRRRTSLAQRLPSDFNEKLLEFQRYVIRLRKQHSYLLGHIGNADQTPVFFDMPTNTTVADKGAKSVVVKTTGNEKNRITVMLSVLADGRKLSPYVILRRKTLPKEKLPKGLIVRCQEKGWMTNELVMDWVKVVWNRRPGALLRQRGMLVLDAFRGHLTPQVKKVLEDGHTDLVVIPGGMTSQLQVLDVVVNKPFKDCLRRQYTEWMMSGDKQVTPTGKLKKPSVALLGEWILTAWNNISSDSIVKGFQKCCISNKLDGSQDDIVWEHLEESETDASSEAGETESESD